jgi:hypothetical protein
MVDMLKGIAEGLDRIHGEGKLHGNLHRKNLLVVIYYTFFFFKKKKQK